MTNTPSILIVDDDQYVRSMLGRTLIVAGYRVREAKNGREALTCCQSQPVDVVIMDIVMPEMEGLEAIRAIRRIKPEAKIIAISGMSPRGPLGYLSIAERFGAARSFAKPLDQELLLATLRELTSGFAAPVNDPGYPGLEERGPVERPAAGWSSDGG